MDWKNRAFKTSFKAALYSRLALMLISCVWLGALPSLFVVQAPHVICKALMIKESVLKCCREP